MSVSELCDVKHCNLVSPICSGLAKCSGVLHVFKYLPNAATWERPIPVCLYDRQPNALALDAMRQALALRRLARRVAVHAPRGARRGWRRCPLRTVQAVSTVHRVPARHGRGHKQALPIVRAHLNLTAAM
eukprot:366460-Chlamydomonas_euryale.AAC.6